MNRKHVAEIYMQMRKTIMKTVMKHGFENRILTMIIGIPLVVLIGFIQVIGMMLVGIGIVVLKTLSVLLTAAAILLSAFGTFSGGSLLVVLFFGAVMFWLPEVVQFLLIGLAYIQGILLEKITTR